MLSDSDAEDEGDEGKVQQQLTTPAARAALTAYSIALSPSRSKAVATASQQQDAAVCRGEACNDAAACSSSSGHEATPQRQTRAIVRQKKGKRRVTRDRDTASPSLQAEEQPMLLQGKAGATLTRDPAKDIARAAARSRPSGVSLTSSLSLVPLAKPSAVGSGLKVSSLHAATAAAASATHFSALEPVEFAIDRPPWRRTSSSGSQRQQDAVDDQDLRRLIAEAAADANGPAPCGFGAPSVVSPILTTAQLDADSMDAARAITDYPWHYNFIPAARRAPTGTAGFASSSSAEQERRRSLLVDAQHRKQALANAVARAPVSDDALPLLQSTCDAISSNRMMGYSRSLSGVARPGGLPSLEINGHPMSMSLDRPSSAQRVTIG